MSTLSQLKEILSDENWPKASPDSQICDLTSEEDKRDRAEQIVNTMIDRPLMDRRFLDVGCGEGHICDLVGEDCRACVGYDLEVSGKSEYLTDDWEVVKEKGPYDVVLLYDVLDHALDPAELLKRVKEVCDKPSVIIIRNHPWCGRHGGHLYHHFNKAYMHLVFTQAEVAELSADIEFETIQHVLHPQKVYREWFGLAGLGNPKHHVMSVPVEPFFIEQELVRDRIKAHWKKSFDTNARRWPQHQMEQSFVDYIIKIKEEKKEGEAT